jgi:radical SAM superfamily enzyme YgiQ (UPF0313 family)
MNVYLFQPQYAVEYRNENTFWIPYSVGCIWSYIQQFDFVKNNFFLKEIIFRREDPEEIISRMIDPKICGFSCYLWNEKYNLLLAEKIKERWPDCAIIFGGAQASGKMLKYDFIDSIIMAEGEENFLDAITHIYEGKPLQKFYNKKRLENLDIPSPYTTGLFDSLIEKHPSALWSVTFETNRGCPFACTFCDWGGVTYSKVRKFDLEKVRADLEWCVNKPIGYLFCADANFGIFKERDLEIARIIKDVSERSKIDSINLQYAKNSTEVVFSIAKILGNISKGVTVSVQSMNDDTLEAIKRKNLDTNDIKKLMRLSEEYDVSTYTEVILGMPLETLESWKQGFDRILEMGQHSSIDMWFTQLLENSEMATAASRSRYGIKSIIAKDYTPLYNKIDWTGVEEEIELIKETNTMSTDEMVEGYLYGWMIIHFHITGYSQLMAKYLRHVLGISYRQFYDELFNSLPGSFLSEHYNVLKKMVSHYLKSGEIIKVEGYTKGGHGIHSMSYEYFYIHRKEIYDFINPVAEKFGLYDSDIIDANRNFIFNVDETYPKIFELKFNITDWQNVPTTYSVESRINSKENFDFYFYRRQGLIKNRFRQIP